MNARLLAWSLALVAVFGLGCGGVPPQSAEPASSLQPSPGEAESPKVIRHSGPDAVEGVWLISLAPSEKPAQAALRTAPLDREAQFAESQQRVTVRAQAMLSSLQAAPRQVYSAALEGFSARLDRAQVDALAQRPEVLRIEQVVRVRGGQSLVQNTSHYQLDRIDQRSGTDGQFVYRWQGTGVHAYVIDSGIRTTHQEFGDGRAMGARNFIDDGHASNEDPAGHGTFVAGMLGGTNFGTAKNVHLHSVRVLDANNSGTTEGVVAGLNWVAGNAYRPAVVNMSIESTSTDPTFDDAVRGVINAGIPVVICAGNYGLDACSVSPSRVTEAIVVGAIDSADRRAIFSDTESSNYGQCVDIWAPGRNVESASHDSDTATSRGWGTSFAAPLVAGDIAQMLEQDPNLTPGEIATRLYGEATKNAVQDVRGGPNRLLFTNVQPLPAPTGVQASPTGPRSVAVSWSRTQPDVHFYDVWRNGGLVASVSGGASSWTDTGVQPTTQYAYAVVARNYYDDWSPASAFAWTWTPGDRALATPLWRYYNGSIGDHYFTVDRNDYGLAMYGYSFESGAARVYASAAGDMVPLYRYYSSGSTDHYYTVTRDDAGAAAFGYAFDRVEGYVYRYPAVGTIPLYRYWNGSIGDHFYTVNWGELGGGGNGWQYEGVEAYVFPY